MRRQPPGLRDNFTRDSDVCDPRTQRTDRKRQGRVATYWEAEALRSAVTTSEWIFIQRVRSCYYIKWRLFATTNSVHKEYDSLMPVTEKLKLERNTLKGEIRNLNDENEELREELHKLRTDMNSVQAKQHNLTRDIDNETSMRRQLEDVASEEREKNERLLAEQEKLRKQNMELKNNAVAANKELEYLKRVAETNGKEAAREREAMNQLQQEMKNKQLQQEMKNKQLQQELQAKQMQQEMQLQQELKNKQLQKELQAKQLQLEMQNRSRSPPKRETITKKTVSEKVSPKNYPELGLCLTDTLPRPLKGKKKVGRQKREDGIKVVGVRGPAKKAGILPEDTVCAINGEQTPDLALFRQILTNLPPKEALSILIERNQQFSTVKIVPNASTEVPGHAFQRLVWLPRDDKPETDISRLAAPKGSYYDENGKLHSIYEDDDVRQSPPGTPRSGGSSSNSPARSPRRASSDKGQSPRRELVGCEGSWTWAPESPRRTNDSPVRRQESIRRGDSPGSEASGYTSHTIGTVNNTGRTSIRVGARVRRNNTYWQWGNQDGGPGNLGTVAKVDKMLGWVTVRWDATGRGSTYRWGKDDAWDVEEVMEARDHVPMGEAAPQRPPPQRVRTHQPQSITPMSHTLYDEEGYSDAASSEPDGVAPAPAYAPHPQL
eukprot:TRINITY_DN20846_c0_g1_i1.p1 TRINITY_DN20846_c0_g1~~TRINITY_DN20846_c0_g1_i1.p1  ORF type:complete len:662 (+),score=161.99 TRINITY_DN20846_c0_g1_i1:60-2045(+)